MCFPLDYHLFKMPKDDEKAGLVVLTKETYQDWIFQFSVETAGQGPDMHRLFEKWHAGLATDSELFEDGRFSDKKATRLLRFVLKTLSPDAKVIARSTDQTLFGILTRLREAYGSRHASSRFTALRTLLSEKQVSRTIVPAPAARTYLVRPKQRRSCEA